MILKNTGEYESWTTKSGLTVDLSPLSEMEQGRDTRKYRAFSNRV